MQISKNKVAAIHYTLRDNEGAILDSSDGRDPLYYIHGIGNLIPGMEDGLEGKATGDKLQIKVDAAKGYGELDSKLVQQVPMTAFGGQEVKEGMQFKAAAVRSAGEWPGISSTPRLHITVGIELARRILNP
jgi:FKBP-type peptidyl-prolyl cis-trans isomerase SlyD